MSDPVVPVVTQDVARFAADDPEALVAASFACPLCLRAACRVRLDDDADVAVARCTCVSCAYGWALELDPAQLLRVWLDPPEAVDLTPQVPRGVRDPWSGGDDA